MPSRRATLAALAATLAGCTAGPGTQSDRSPTDPTGTDPDGPTPTSTPTAIETVDVDHPAVAWAIRLPRTVRWSPVVSDPDGRLFVGTGDGPRGTPVESTPTAAAGTVFALDAADGAEAWRETTAAPLAGEPAFHDGRLHVVTGRSTGYDGLDQRVTAYAPDGTRRWRTEPRSGWLSVVASHEGTTFVATGDDAVDTGDERLFGLAPDGAVAWEREVGDPWGATVADGALLYSHGGVELGAYDPVDGANRWRIAGDPVGGATSSVAAFEGFCFTQARERSDAGYPLVARSLADGRERWRYAFDVGSDRNFVPVGVAGLAAVDGAPLLVGTEYGGTAFALDADGTEAWRFEAAGEISSRPPVVGDRVYVGTKGGTLHALDPVTGEERWRTSLQRVDGVRAVDGGVVVDGGGDGLVVLDADGGERWRYTPSGGVGGGGVTDDRLYAVVGDRSVVAFDLASGA